MIEKSQFFTPQNIVKSVLGVIAFSILWSTFYVVQEYERGVVTRLGEVKEIVQPGIHFKVPFVDEVHFADTRVESFSIEGTEIATKDNQIVTLDLTINHRINSESDEGIINLYKQFGKRFAYEDRILRKLAVDRIKSTMGSMNIDEIIPNRDAKRLEALSKIQSAVAEYGIDVLDTQLNDFGFSSTYRSNLEKVAQARAAAAEAAQQERQAKFIANKAIEAARGESESKKLQAEAEAYRVKQTAEAKAFQIQIESEQLADAIKREGEAKAEALKLQAKAMSTNSDGLVALTQAEAMKNWKGHVPRFMTGDGTNGGIFPFMNMKDFESKK